MAQTDGADGVLSGGECFLRCSRGVARKAPGTPGDGGARARAASSTGRGQEAEEGDRVRALSEDAAA